MYKSFKHPGSRKPAPAVAAPETAPSHHPSTLRRLALVPEAWSPPWPWGKSPRRPKRGELFQDKLSQPTAGPQSILNTQLFTQNPKICVGSGLRFHYDDGTVLKSLRSLDTSCLADA